MREVIQSDDLTVTTPGTAVPFKSELYLVSSLFIRAKTDNTDLVYLGGSDVSSSDPGWEAFAIINWDGDQNSGVIDLSLQYLDAAVGGEGVDYLYVDAE
jgi:hypothetical protein